MERKSIRLSGTSYAVLALLAELGESTPYDLKQALTESIENFWPVPHSTFYAEPARLAAAGLLSERQEQHGRRRKLYTLTDAGRAALGRWAGNGSAAPPQIHDETLLKIFAGADPLPLLRQRRDWHVAKLAELQALHDDNPWRLRDGEGPKTTLLVGIDFHRLSIEKMDSLLAAVEGR
jgi:DNA-binding PadR family transcriptional regulator